MINPAIAKPRCPWCPGSDAYIHYHDLEWGTPEADAMSKDLNARGFRFMGPTICYAFMQAPGMANDHLVRCFRYRQLVPATTGRTARRRA